MKHHASGHRSSALTLALLAPLAAHAIDLDPGDYVPAPAGTTVAVLYAQHVQRDKLYAKGQRLPLNAGLSSNTGIARFVRFVEVGGITIAPQVLVPFGRLSGEHDTRTLGRSGGVGDVILAAPTWIVNDAAGKTHWGVTPIVYLPTGSYEKERALNLGENRWKFNLQTGIAKGIGGPWHIDLTGDVMLHGKNADHGRANATLRQKPLFNVQGHLRYQFSPAANVYAGLSQYWGGRTRIDGVENDDETRQLKASVGTSLFIGPRTQILGAVGRDLHVRHGFKENLRLSVRLMQIL